MEVGEASGNGIENSKKKMEIGDVSKWSKRLETEICANGVVRSNLSPFFPVCVCVPSSLVSHPSLCLFLSLLLCLGLRLVWSPTSFLTKVWCGVIKIWNSIFLYIIFILLHLDPRASTRTFIQLMYFYHSIKQLTYLRIIILFLSLKLIIVKKIYFFSKTNTIKLFSLFYL